MKIETIYKVGEEYFTSKKEASSYLKELEGKAHKNIDILDEYIGSYIPVIANGKYDIFYESWEGYQGIFGGKITDKIETVTVRQWLKGFSGGTTNDPQLFKALVYFRADIDILKLITWVS